MKETLRIWKKKLETEFSRKQNLFTVENKETVFESTKFSNERLPYLPGV